MPIAEKLDYPVNMDVVRKYFKVTDNPVEADYALVFIESPNTGNGYQADDVKSGGNGYLPISLQYDEYKAVNARETSIAGRDPLETFTNRTYKNKTIKANNITDLAMVNDTYAKMKGKPVIVAMNLSNPAVFSEFEKNANAILVHFGALDQALLDILTGIAEPSALLPLQLPLDMNSVEKQAEDLPHDMEVFVDGDGNKYDFGFGLNWKGVISDARTSKYGKPSAL